MDFRTFWSSLEPARKDAFAVSIKRSRNYLDQIACGARKPSHIVAREISDASHGMVPLHKLRGDIWDAPSGSKHSEVEVRDHLS